MTKQIAQEQDLGFAAKMERDIFTIQPNIGRIALDHIMHAEVVSPFDMKKLSKDERESILTTTHQLEDEHCTPFAAVRMLLRSSTEGCTDLQESIFVTCVAEQGIDAQKFDVPSKNLMSVLQYAALFKSVAAIDQRPQKREPVKPFVKAVDYGDAWTSTLLHHPTRKNALYSGLVKDKQPRINVITPDRALAQENLYKVRPVVAIL